MFLAGLFDAKGRFVSLISLTKSQNVFLISSKLALKKEDSLVHSDNIESEYSACILVRTFYSS